MIIIGGILAFVALLKQRERLLELIPPGAFADYIRTASLSAITLAGAAALVAVLVVKNAYIVTLVLAEARILRDVTVRVSSRLRYVATAVRAADKMPVGATVAKRVLYTIVNTLSFASLYRLSGI